jgi:hypothetical protein
MNDVYEVLKLRDEIKNFEKNKLRILITFRYGFSFIKNGAMRYVQILCDELIRGGHKLTLIFDNQRKDVSGVYDNNFDLIIVNHADHFKTLNFELDAPIIHIVHSELYEIDKPLIGFDRIKYVAVRTEIKDFLIKDYSIDPNLISVILNPIETKKFNSILTKNDRIEIDKIGGPYGLFVGAVTYIRVQAIISFSNTCRKMGLISVYAVGDFITEENLQFLNQHFDVVLNFKEDIHSLFKGASLTGGIQKGRTYWEGKLCKRTVCEYMVDPKGEIYDVLVEDATDKDAALVAKVVDPSFVVELLIDLGMK